MKIEPKSGPSISAPPQTQASIPTLSPRERAIAKLMETTQSQPPQQMPVSNPNQVQPEELSVIKPPTSQAPEKEAQNNSIETSSEEKAPPASEASKSEMLSTQYANLARKEKALRAKVQAQEAAFKAKEADLVAKEEALKAKEAEYLSNYIPKSKLKQDPLAVLTEQGVSYEDLTQAILNPQFQQDPRVLAEIEKLKTEVQKTQDLQNKARQQYEDQQKQAYNQAVAEIRSEARQLVSSDPSFETIKETNSVNDIVDLIEKTYAKDKILLTVEEAAKEVEEYLVEEALKLSRIKKIKDRLAPAEARQQVSAQKQSEEQSKQQPQMKTLTNSVNSAKKLSARERAIAAFEGKLK